MVSEGPAPSGVGFSVARAPVPRARFPCAWGAFSGGYCGGVRVCACLVVGFLPRARGLSCFLVMVWRFSGGCEVARKRREEAGEV